MAALLAQLIEPLEVEDAALQPRLAEQQPQALVAIRQRARRRQVDGQQPCSEPSGDCRGERRLAGARHTLQMDAQRTPLALDRIEQDGKSAPPFLGNRQRRKLADGGGDAAESGEAAVEVAAMQEHGADLFVELHRAGEQRLFGRADDRDQPVPGPDRPARPIPAEQAQRDIDGRSPCSDIILQVSKQAFVAEVDLGSERDDQRPGLERGQRECIDQPAKHRIFQRRGERTGHDAGKAGR